MLRAALTLLTVPTLALAEPETLEGKQRALAFEGDPLTGMSMQAFAQLAGGAAGDSADRDASSDIAVGADIVAKGENCTHARAGGQARFGWSSEWKASAEQWASVCAAFAGTAQVGIGHHLEWDVRPSLLAPLGMRAGRNRRETISFRLAPLQVSRAELERTGNLQPGLPRLAPPPGELIVFDIYNDLTFLWSPDGPISTRGVPYVIPFGYRSPQQAPWGEDRDLLVAIGTAGGEFIDDGASIFFWITEIDNLALGPMLLSAGAGIASAGAGELDPMTQKNEVDVTTLRAKLGIETGNETVHGHLRAESDAGLAPDGYVVVERKLTSGGSLELGKSKLVLDGVVSRTKAYVPGLLRSSGLVGGGALAFVRELTRHLRASVQVEVARGFYAVDAVAPQDFAPRWGARAFAVLQAVARR